MWFDKVYDFGNLFMFWYFVWLALKLPAECVLAGENGDIP